MWPKDRKQQGHRSNSSVHLFFLCLKTWGAYPCAPVFPTCSCQAQCWDKAQHCSAECLFPVEEISSKASSFQQQACGKQATQRAGCQPPRGSAAHRSVRSIPHLSLPGDLSHSPGEFFHCPVSTCSRCCPSRSSFGSPIPITSGLSLWYPSALLRPLRPHQEH